MLESMKLEKFSLSWKVMKEVGQNHVGPDFIW